MGSGFAGGMLINDESRVFGMDVGIGFCALGAL
jgi:hypothetical protein